MKNKNNKTVLIGAYVPEHQAEYISLMALQHQIAKSAWLRHQLEKTMDTGPSLTTLIRSIAHTIAEQWDQALRNNIGVYWKTKQDIKNEQQKFMQNQYDHLTKKGVSTQTAEEIVEKAKAIYREKHI